MSWKQKKCKQIQKIKDRTKKKPKNNRGIRKTKHRPKQFVKKKKAK